MSTPTITPAMARRIEIWPAERLVPYAKNARTHGGNFDYYRCKWGGINERETFFGQPRIEQKFGQPAVFQVIIGIHRELVYRLHFRAVTLPIHLDRNQPVGCAAPVA